MYVTCWVHVSDEMKSSIEKKWTVNWAIAKGINDVKTVAQIKDVALQAVRDRIKAATKGRQPKSYSVLRLYCKVPEALLAENPDHPPELDVTEDDDILGVIQPMARAKAGRPVPVVIADIGYVPNDREKVCSKEQFAKKVSESGLAQVFTVEQKELPRKKNLSTLLSREEKTSNDEVVTTITCKVCKWFHAVEETNHNHRLDMRPLHVHVQNCKDLDGFVERLKSAKATTKAGIKKIREGYGDHKEKMKTAAKTKRGEATSIQKEDKVSEDGRGGLQEIVELPSPKRTKQEEVTPQKEKEEGTAESGSPELQAKPTKADVIVFAG